MVENMMEVIYQANDELQIDFAITYTCNEAIDD